MNMTQQKQFSDRITRIQAGGANTCATVYCGAQSINTPKDQAVEGVLVRGQAPSSSTLTKKHLMRAGLRSGLAQVSVLGGLLAAYIRYVGA